MLDIDTSVDQLVDKLPGVPLTGSDICDGFFKAPTTGAQYIIKTPSDMHSELYLKIAGNQDPDTAKYACTRFTHFIPNKGYAVVTGGDVGHPTALQIKTGSMLPPWIAVKKVGDAEWSRFDLTKGISNQPGSMVAHSTATVPTKTLLSDRFLPNVLRVDKQYALEFLRAVTGR